MSDAHMTKPLTEQECAKLHKRVVIIGRTPFFRGLGNARELPGEIIPKLLDTIDTLRAELKQVKEKKRRIDDKFHISGSRIVNMTNGQEIPLEEPLFLIRARDYLAIPLLRHYASISGSDSCTDHHMSGIAKAISEFETFRDENQEKMKQPGITKRL